MTDIAVVKVRHTLQSLKGGRMALTVHTVPHPEAKVLKQQLFFFISDQQHEIISKAVSLQF